MNKERQQHEGFQWVPANKHYLVETEAIMTFNIKRDDTAKAVHIHDKPRQDPQ
jgi:hypothetical protein